MAILIDKNTEVLVQGITGKEGVRATQFMLNYKTKVVAGVRPGKAGENVEGVPVYDTVKAALQAHPKISISLIIIPPKVAKHAVKEAIEAGIKTICVVTENMPIKDTAYCIALAEKHNAKIIGPTSIGIISPGKSKVGLIGGNTSEQFTEGNVGIISKSGGMSSETANILTQVGIGQSTVVGMGADVLIGTTIVELLEMFKNDDQTKVVVIFGEIGGTAEEDASDYIKKTNYPKPVIAFISGKFAEILPNTTLGHAGAIVEGNKGTRAAKVEALKDAGVHVVEVHHEIVDKVKELII
ncbi:succinate--CoA ligase subunit alpha [Candidatus Woesearchaeota archaeon CG10_big_fil_rev_8_21_14_0_10_34_8]|nr:MAG: succinate--CoA ligase subunit alpha [Candidatus Woesearchaeota archaeon CG10_big_fil_rev_8_21_14_0_10_34_8]